VKLNDFLVSISSLEGSSLRDSRFLREQLPGNDCLYGVLTTAHPISLSMSLAAVLFVWFEWFIEL